MIESPIYISHVERLLLSTDGRISPADFAAACRLDAAQRGRHPRAIVPVGRVRLKPHMLVELMAHTIVRCVLDRACVTAADMIRAGLTERDAATHREAAFARARQIEPRLDLILGEAAA